MSVVTLPSTPGFQSAKLIYRSSRKQFRSPLTGSAVVNHRPADYFAAELRTPPMRGDLARQWIAKLVRGAGLGVVVRWPQPDLAIGSPGTPTVYLGGQTGSSINITGGTPGYVLREGQFFSFVNGAGRFELKMSTTNVTLTGSPVAVPIYPAIRSSPGNAAQVQITQPYLQGILSEGDQSWEWTGENPYALTINVEAVE